MTGRPGVAERRAGTTSSIRSFVVRLRDWSWN